MNNKLPNISIKKAITFITNPMKTPVAFHFTLSEFFNSETAKKHGIDNTPSRSVKVNIIKIASVLEVIRYNLGSLPIKINSGYRCSQLNTIVGGVPTSRHLSGKAADIFIPHQLPSIVSSLLDDLKTKGIIRYWYTISPYNYHVDIY